MRESEKIEAYLNGNLSGADKLVMEARFVLHPALEKQRRWQQITYRFIRVYGRKKLRQEVQEMDSLLFSAPEFKKFQQQIQAIFQNP